MRPLLIAGYYGFDNLGDEAILECLLRGLAERLPEARPVVLSGSPQRTRQRHGVDAVDRADIPAVTALARQAGLVVLGGGGLFQDYWPAPLAHCLEPKGGGLPFYLRFPIIAAATDCPLAIVGVGVGPLKGEESRQLAAAAFELATSASVRDGDSLELLRGICPGRPEPFLGADPATLLEPAPEGEVDALLAELGLAPGEPLLGVAPRPWAFGTDPSRWEWEVALGIEVYLASHAGSALLLPFQPSGGDHGENDQTVCSRLAAQIRQPGRVHVVHQELRPALVAALLGRCELVLAMRYHAALLSLLAGVPTVALAYDPKVSSLLDETRLNDLAIKPGDWTSSAVTTSLELAAEPSLRRRLVGLPERWRARATRALDLAASSWGSPVGRGFAIPVLGRVGLALADEVRSARDQGVPPIGRAPAERSSGDPTCAMTPDDHRVISSARRFLYDQQQREREPSILVISGTSCDESSGQRPAQLARAFQQRGAKVLFAYFRWPGDPIAPESPFGEGLFTIPLDLLVGHANLIADVASATSHLALVEFPYPPLFETLCSVKTHGWAVVYDVLDDWPAFHRSGEAPWFDDAFERWLIREADEVCAVSPSLAEQIRQRSGRIARVVGNAARSDLSLDCSPVVAPRGELTIGYFGYLSAAWFDWELIHELAVLRPTWAFHIVGYGEPAGLRLPANVHLLGRQPSTTLGSIARWWDVGIVPFRDGDVARNADPIKIYEYLALGLPVVTRAVSPPPGTDGFVVRAESCADVIAALENAHRLGDENARQALARALTWDCRAGAILSAAESTWSRLRSATGGSELWR